MRSSSCWSGGTVQQEAVRQEATRRAESRRQRTRWGVRLSLVAGAAAAVAALVLVARSDSGEVRTSDERGSTTTSTEVTTPSSSTTTPPDSSTSSTTPPDPSTTSTSSSSTTSTTTAPPALPEFPPEFTGVTQGGQAWALYLAVVPAGQYDAPELAAATEAGYGGAGPSELACDQGAAEALGRDSSSVAAAVHFETEADANQARAAFEARGTQVVGVVNVTTYCLD